ncbi:hypothetical protein [Lactobacillus delbrueckii]|uniref:hypothetical protein n=1 Tax=Lactobacillus delbrueckii TaxID=1584 RepID=UPI003A8B4BB8
MDQNAQKPLSRLARQQAVREERKNKQAPWWTALLIAVMMALAAVPLITSQNSDYAVPQAKKEQAKPKPAVEKTSKAKPAPKVKTYVVKAGDKLGRDRPEVRHKRRRAG